MSRAIVPAPSLAAPAFQPSASTVPGKHLFRVEPWQKARPTIVIVS